MAPEWRTLAATHLRAAADALEANRDRVFLTEFGVVVGYLHAQSKGEQRLVALKLLEALRRELEVSEVTQQLTLEPGELERLASLAEEADKKP